MNTMHARKKISELAKSLVRQTIELIFLAFGFCQISFLMVVAHEKWCMCDSDRLANSILKFTYSSQM